MVITGVPGSGVRPTRRCLDQDLGLGIPNLAVALEGLEHELIQKAQRLPEEVAAGGEERILALDDRVWLKVKTDAWRGAATAFDLLGPDHAPAGRWWLGAAGARQDDSPQRDFYKQLQRQCESARARANEASGGGSTKTALTDHLLPDEWDRDRLTAELAYQAHQATKRLICRMAAESMRTMKVIGFDFDSYEVRVLVRAKEQEAYIAIAAAGMADANAFAMLLGAIPGITADDWMPEPGGHPELGLQPGPGEILWSAVLPPDIASQLLEDADPDD